MGRGKKLSVDEIKVIINLRKEGKKIVEIADIVQRSKTAVAQLLKNPENYGKKKSTGRPRALSARDERKILRVASNSMATAKEIAEKAGISTNVRNVQRILKKSPTIKRKKMLRKPPLTEEHMKKRQQFAEQHIRWRKRWKRVIFTDEKRFNLDGPDGWSYYFHDLRKSELFQQRRQMGGGSIMIWAGIGFNGTTNIRFIDGRMTSKDYISLLREEILPKYTEISGENYIFQHDNAAVHTALDVKRFFLYHNINVLEWPARSPDLNIIENVWGHLARCVYRGNKQYSTTEELKTAVEVAWRTLPRKYIKKLYKSLHSRMLEVVRNKGKTTHY